MWAYTLHKGPKTFGTLVRGIDLDVSACGILSFFCHNWSL